MNHKAAIATMVEQLAFYDRKLQHLEKELNEWDDDDDN